jgi:hypothetical protein
MGSSSWQKLFGTEDNFGSSVSFFTSMAGEYVLLGQAELLAGVPLNYPSRDILEKFMQKYDLSGVFYGINSSFAPGNSVSNQELILLYEKVTGNEYTYPGSSIRQKATYYGLDRIVGTIGYLTGTTRQKAAAVIIKVYCEKTGIVLDYFSPPASVFIRDEDEIGSLYYKPVFMSVQMNMLATDWEKNFRPHASITRAEAIVAFYNMLKLTGEF